MREPTSEGYQFGAFQLSRPERALLCDGQQVRLARKAVELLLLLVQSPGRTLSKRELMDALWPELAVHENSLPVAVHALRRVLGARFIETVPRRGYRFVGPVRCIPAPALSAAVVAPAASVPAASTHGAFVGREAELLRLLGFFEQARHGHGQVVFVSGEAGMGKSALLRQFRTALAAHGEAAQLATGRCVESYGPSEPYLPFVEAVTELLSGAHGPSLAAQLRAHAPSWCARFPAFFECSPPAAAPASAAGREGRLRQLAHALGAWSSERPLILVLEDLHWADPSSLDLLQFFSSYCAGQRWLVLGTFRPELSSITPGSARESSHVAEYLSALASERGLRVLGLRPLTQLEVHAYLQACFPQNDFSTPLAALVLRKTEGLPLFATRWIDTLREQGHIEERAGTAVLTRELAEFERWAPDSLVSLIRQRFAQLPAAAQRALGFASVEGEEFRASVLAELLEQSPLEVEEQLAAIAQRYAWIQVAGEEELPDGVLTERYRFSHALYQNVLCEGLSSQRRCALHRQVAGALEAHGCGRRSRYFAELGLHLERGRSFSRAVTALIVAGDHTDRTHAPREALGYYARARALLAKLPESERLAFSLILEHGEGWVEFGCGRLKSALGHFGMLVRQAHELEARGQEPVALAAIVRAFDYFEAPWSETRLGRSAPIMPNQSREQAASAVRAEGLMCQCNVLGGCARWVDLRARAGELLELATATHNQPRRAEALAWLALDAVANADLPHAERLLDECIALARGLDHPRALLLVLDRRAWLHALGGELPEAISAYQETLDLALTTSAVADCLIALGDLHALQGELGRAFELHRQVSELLHWVCPEGPPCFAGWIFQELGAAQRGSELDASALRAVRPFGRIDRQLRLACQLARSQAELGDFEAAELALREAESLGATAHPERSWLHGLLWNAQAELALLRQHYEQAESLALRALRLARAERAHEIAADASSLLARSALGRADLSRARSHVDMALQLLAPAPLRLWKALALLARITACADERDTALEAAARARELVQQLLSKLPEGPLRASLQRDLARQLEPRAGEAPCPRSLRPTSQNLGSFKDF